MSILNSICNFSNLKNKNGNNSIVSSFSGNNNQQLLFSVNKTTGSDYVMFNENGNGQEYYTNSRKTRNAVV